LSIKVCIAGVNDEKEAEVTAKAIVCATMDTAILSFTTVRGVHFQPDPTHKTVRGSFGTRFPSHITKICDGKAVTCAGSTICLRPADRFLAPSYLCTIAAYVGNSRELSFQFRKHLTRATKAWIAQTAGRTGFVKSMRNSADNNWVLCDLSCCLLADFICQYSLSPSGFYCDFVYHLNSTLSNFDMVSIVAAKDRKDQRRKIGKGPKANADPDAPAPFAFTLPSTPTAPVTVPTTILPPHIQTEAGEGGRFGWIAHLLRGIGTVDVGSEESVEDISISSGGSVADKSSTAKDGDGQWSAKW
jgi:hypothetical protein